MKRVLAWMLALMMLCCALPVTAENVETEEQTHILLIGEDSRKDVHQGGRADAIMICSVGADGQVKLISMARDLWIEMDTGFADRINAAYRYGGPELLLKAVNQTLQMDISQYISINFYGFCDVVDMLGGVEVELEPNEASAINKKTSETYGNMEVVPIPRGATSAVLCGAQALGYARIRELDSDRGRTGRQRKVLTALVNAYKNKSVTEMGILASDILSTGFIKTDMSSDEILNYVKSLFPMLASATINSQQIPANGTFESMNVGSVTDCKVADLEANRQILKNILQ